MIRDINIDRLANKHPRVNILQPGCGVEDIVLHPYTIVSDMESKS